MPERQIPITGLPAHAEYHEFHKESWHKGIVVRNQTTIRLRKHHLELIQNIAEQLPLYLSRKMDLSRWEFGHAGILIRSLARVQLRDQLMGDSAPPVKFVKRQPRTPDEVLACCFQSAKRCEVDLDLDRLRDTLLDILILLMEVIASLLKKDAEFCSDNKKTLEQWVSHLPPYGRFGCEGYLKHPSDMNPQNEGAN
jgi:hypothetical protein